MVMPAYIPFLKTPCNLPEPKEKHHFSISGLLGEQGGAGDEANQDGSQDYVNEDEVEYDKIVLDHFNPAFKRPGVTHVVRNEQLVPYVVEMMGLG